VALQRAKSLVTSSLFPLEANSEGLAKFLEEGHFVFVEAAACHSRAIDRLSRVRGLDRRLLAHLLNSRMDYENHFGITRFLYDCEMAQERMASSTSPMAARSLGRMFGVPLRAAKLVT